MSFMLALIALGVIINAQVRNWPIRTSLFPIVIGAVVFIIAMVELLLSLFGREDSDKEKTLDVDFSTDVDESLVTRRTMLAFGWIVALFFVILLFGFIYAVPLFSLFCTKVLGNEKWGISIAMAISTWVFFYGLFVWLLHTVIHEGWIFRWLGAL